MKPKGQREGRKGNEPTLNSSCEGKEERKEGIVN